MEAVFITMFAAGAVALANGYSVLRANTAQLEQGRFGAQYLGARGALSIYVRRSATIMVALGVFVLALLFAGMPRLGWESAAAFLLGAALSFAGAYGSAAIAVRSRFYMREHGGGTMATFRVALQSANNVAGIVVGLALFSVAAVYVMLGGGAFVFAALALGVSLVAVIARLGGGVYAAGILSQDVSASESRLALTDSAVAAASVFGETAELFQTITVALAGAVILGTVLFAGLEGAATLPIMIVAAGFGATILSMQLVRVGMTHNILRNIYLFVGATALLGVLFFFPLVSWLMSGNAEYATVALFGASVVGIAVGALTLFLGEYYGSVQLGPVGRVVRAARTKSARFVLSGFVVGFEGAAVAGSLITVGVLAGFGVAGMYGVGLAAAGMLAFSAAALVVHMLGIISEADTRTATGHIARSVSLVGPLFGVVSAVIAILAFFVTVRIIGAEHVANAAFVGNVPLIAGMLAGVAATALFVSLIAGSTLRGSAFVRRALRIKEESAEEYVRASDVAAKKSMRSAVYPGALALALPVLIGFILGFEILSGLLLGMLLTSGVLAITFVVAGGAWRIASRRVVAAASYEVLPPPAGGALAAESSVDAVLAEGAQLGALLSVGVAPALTTIVKTIVVLALLLIPFFT